MFDDDGKILGGGGGGKFDGIVGGEKIGGGGGGRLFCTMFKGGGGGRIKLVGKGGGGGKFDKLGGGGKFAMLGKGGGGGKFGKDGGGGKFGRLIEGGGGNVPMLLFELMPPKLSLASSKALAFFMASGLPLIYSLGFWTSVYLGMLGRKRFASRNFLASENPGLSGFSFLISCLCCVFFSSSSKPIFFLLALSNFSNSLITANEVSYRKSKEKKRFL